MDTSRYPGPTVFQAHSTIYKTTFDQPRVMVANNLPHKSVDATIFIIMGAPKGHDNCFVNLWGQPRICRAFRVFRSF